LSMTAMPAESLLDPATLKYSMQSPESRSAGPALRTCGSSKAVGREHKAFGGDVR
jgi:hypothetical protein